MDVHHAHVKGLLAYFSGEVKEPPPQGERGTVEFAYRAGWMSAKKALEGKNGDPR
jgi:hypothetical protein